MWHLYKDDFYDQNNTGYLDTAAAANGNEKSPMSDNTSVIDNTM